MRGISVVPKYDAARWHAAPASVLRFESVGWSEAVAEAVEKAKSGNGGGGGGGVRVAAYDMDGTLIKTASGAKFPKHPADLALWDDCVPEKLRKVADSGSLIVIFTNQAGVASAKCGGADGMRSRIEKVAALLGIPLAAYAATARDRYRKPQVGMWELFKSHLPSAVAVVDNSTYVGDALGRPTDFSDSDIKFALNVGLHCESPEEHFRSSARPRMLVKPYFNPHDLIADLNYTIGLDALPPLSDIIQPASLVDKLTTKHRHIVVLQGAPCSGKSTFARLHLPHHTRLCDASASRLKAALESEEAAVVVDGAHMTKTSRVKVTEMARKLNVPVYCLRMDTPKEVVLHLNVVREVVSDPASGVKQLKIVAFNTYYKREQKPSDKEDFDAIGVVKFLPTFENEQEKEVFLRYTTN